VAAAAAAKASRVQAVAAVVRQPMEQMVLELFLGQLEQAEQVFHSRFLATMEEICNHMVTVVMVE
jgi:hypothetical protein